MAVTMEQWKKICTDIFKMLADRVETEIKDPANFRLVGYRLNSSSTDMAYTADVVPSHVDPEEPCCIRLGCAALDSDKLFSNFVFWGSKQQVMDWLVDPNSVEEALRYYQALRARCLDD